MKKITSACISIGIALLLLPSIHLGFIYTQGLGKIAIIIAFITFILDSFHKRKRFHFTIEHFAVCLLTLTTSLSIIAVVDLGAFFSRYITFLIPILLYYILSLEHEYKDSLLNKIITVLIIVFFINIIIQLGLAIAPDPTTRILQNILPPLYVEYILANLERDRIYLIAYSESYLPIIFYQLTQEKKIINRFVLGIGIFLQTILSIYSKFRSMFIMLIISYIGSFLSLRKTKKNFFTAITFLSFAIIYSLILFSLSNYTIFDRLTVQNDNDLQTILYRFEQIPKSLYIASNATFGVGLGNYLYYVSNPFQTSLISPQNIARTDQMPHNIFLEKAVETGIVGLLSYVFLIGVFISKDLRSYAKSSQFQKLCMISFWTLFSYALFNPSYDITYNTLFFLFRALL